jgi:hypothetical protein
MELSHLEKLPIVQLLENFPAFYGMVWIGLIWLRIGTSGGFL